MLEDKLPWKSFRAQDGVLSKLRSLSAVQAGTSISSPAFPHPLSLPHSFAPFTQLFSFFSLFYQLDFTFFLKFKFFSRTLYTNIIFTTFPSLTLPSNSSCAPISSQIDDAFFSVFVTHVCIYRYHLLRPFRVTCVYMCLGLTPWDWIALIRELSPGED